MSEALPLGSREPERAAQPDGTPLRRLPRCVGIMFMDVLGAAGSCNPGSGISSGEMVPLHVPRRGGEGQRAHWVRKGQIYHAPWQPMRDGRRRFAGRRGARDPLRVAPGSRSVPFHTDAS